MEKLKELRKLLEELEQDFKKFYERGIVSAGTRVRVGMQKVKTIANDIRAEVQEKKKSK